MTEVISEEVSAISDDFLKLDKLIDEDPYIRNVITSLLDSFFSEVNLHDYIDDYLSSIFDEDIAKLIELLLVDPDIVELIKERKFKHSVFYLSLPKAYSNKLYKFMMTKINPFYLESISPVDTSKETLFRLVRADNNYFDIYNNAATAVYVIKTMVTYLKNADEDYSQKHHLFESMRSSLESLTKIIKEYEENVTDDGDSNEPDA